MYDLHQLGWFGFQQLCQTILREILGQTVESYLNSNDGGRDGAFTGVWTQKGKEKMEGKFVFQCKFTGQKEGRLKMSDLSDELVKAKRLVLEGNCDCYVLITNAGVSGQLGLKIESSFINQGVKQISVFGADWIIQQINENKRLRMMVPRIYGLGDLTEILDERAYSQAQELLLSLKEELSKVVITGAYQKAAEALDKYGFVLLIGSPAAGKTTIASLLAMAALDQWNSSTLKLDDAEKLIDHWNPNHPLQFFWIDDAFGVTQYESYLSHGWNHAIPKIKAMLNQGHKIVMTSRDYIYNRARKDLKEGAFPLFQESKVVIDVHDLKQSEKKQILYNHIKLGKQPKQFKVEIKPHLESVVSEPRFIPEIARRLSDPSFTANLSIDNLNIRLFVREQKQFLHDILLGLDNHCKAALALIFMRSDNLQGPIKLEESESLAISRLNSSLGGCTLALDSMKDSLVKHSNAEGYSVWRFKHPTIGDAFSDSLKTDPELLEIFIQGSPTSKLISQITCGNTGIQQAVVIPKNLYSLVISKLTQYSNSDNFKSQFLSKWDARSRLNTFLAFRCSKDFLSIYISENPSILDIVSKPGLMLDAASEVDLALTLFKNDLLPEQYRMSFIKVVSKYAIKGDDIDALKDSRIRNMFKPEELQALKDSIREQLVPNLGYVRKKWEDDYEADYSSDSYMEPFVELLKFLQDEFSQESMIVDAAENELIQVSDWIDENEDRQQDYDRAEKLGEMQPAEDFESDRSIFDDIDT